MIHRNSTRPSRPSAAAARSSSHPRGSLLRRTLGVAALAVALGLVSEGAAQPLPVTSLDSHVPKYNDRREIILFTIKHDSIPLDRKLAIYEARMSALRAEFRQARIAEYEQQRMVQVADKSCTNGSGGNKDCGAACFDSPSPELWTQREWTTYEGPDKGWSVTNTPQSSRVCVPMSRAGKGRNYGKATSTFRYRPDAVSRRVDEDVTTLFNRISRPGTGS